MRWRPVGFLLESRGRHSESKNSLPIFNPFGREVTTPADEELKPGNYEVKWDATNFASGVYFYRLQAGNYVATKKLLLLK